MIGICDQSWLIDLLSSPALERAPFGPAIPDHGESVYAAYFGLGHHLKLHDRPGVFKVSLAGMALGSHLLKGLLPHELSGKSLDLGTGGGVLALLLRSLGAGDVTASDVSESAVDLARENEALNFATHEIRFTASDLFADLPWGDRYDTIIFNPPGWRTPSGSFLNHLADHRSGLDMMPDAMFYGDKILLRFLEDLPSRMRPNGRAIVGMNSLVGIRDVLTRYERLHPDGAPLSFRLLERHSLPLFFYSPAWRHAEPLLRKEFENWRETHGAAYSVDRQGRLYWSYEVVECRWRHEPHVERTRDLGATDLDPGLERLQSDF